MKCQCWGSDLGCECRHKEDCKLEATETWIGVSPSTKGTKLHTCFLCGEAVEDLGPCFFIRYSPKKRKH